MKNPQNLPLHVRLVDLANAIVLDEIDVDFDPVSELTLAVEGSEQKIKSGKSKNKQSTRDIESNVS